MTCYSNAISRRKKLESLDWTGLQNKIKSAKSIILKAMSENNYPVIAFSGGKDSIVVLDLVRKIEKNTIGVFCNTGNEYPETIQFVHAVIYVQVCRVYGRY